MEYYVYILVNSLDDDIIYVGKGQKQRMFTHRRHAVNHDEPGKKNKFLFFEIKNIIKLGGDVKAIKIYENLDESAALEKEAEVIAFIGIDNLCNICEYGGGGTPNKNSEEYDQFVERSSQSAKKRWNDPAYRERMMTIRAEQGINMRGQNHPMYGKTHSDESKEKMKNASKGKKWTEQQREKIVTSLTGRKILWADKISASHKTMWETKPRIPFSPERIERMRQASTGRIITHVPDETKKYIEQFYIKFGTNRVQEELDKIGITISKYIIRRTLKELGIYKKYRKSGPL